jgi:hypothetical protein
MLRTIPRAPGQPRLVWRTTTSAEMVVPPTVALVSEVLDPILRATPALLRPGEPIRVAILRSSNASGVSYAGLFVSTLRYNGKSALENGEAFRQIVVPDVLGARLDEATLGRVVAEIVAFAPHLVLDGGGLDGATMRAVERAWPVRDKARPRYVVSSVSEPEIAALIQERPEAHRRILGVETVTTSPAVRKLVLRYNEVFSPKTTAEGVTGAPYDAFYVLAYAAAALGDQPVTGVALARAIPRLLPPGDPIDVGPAGIFTALHALEGGKTINLAGSMTSLDFDLETGDPTADFSVQCVSAAGQAVESGVVYDARSGRLQGRLHCPP